MMWLLAIDTSSDACSVALQVEDILLERHRVAPRQHGEFILSMIDELLKEARCTLAQLNAIALGYGPGSFTGVRLGTCVAQGLAFAKNIPVLCISSLAIAAQTAFEKHGWRKNVVAMDARMSEVYAGYYEINQEGVAISKMADCVCAPDQLTISVENNGYGVGSGFRVYAEALHKAIGQPLAIDADLLPHAKAMLPLARLAFAAGQGVSARQVLPLYLRDDVTS